MNQTRVAGPPTSAWSNKDWQVGNNKCAGQKWRSGRWPPHNQQMHQTRKVILVVQETWPWQLATLSSGMANQKMCLPDEE
jgi:hypothetical protein